MDYYLCIDIGGTAIKYNVYDDNGKEQQTVTSVPTLQTTQGTEIIEALFEIGASTQKKYNLSGICISSAGVVDTELGRIIYSGYTIPNYTGTEIKNIIEKEFGIRCEVENDVNCACLGEFWQGAGKHASSLACLTIGTGIGGALMLGDHLIHGYSYTAGEIGYMNILGQNFQDLASTASLAKRVNERKGLINEEKLDGRMIFELAKKGDIICSEEIDYMTEMLVIGIANILYLFNPEVLVLGGGIMAQKEFLEEKISAKLAEKMIHGLFNQTKLKFAEKGNDAGMLGALYHFKNKK